MFVSFQSQVLTAATEVAKHTSALCNICRVASSKTSNPVAKKHFVQSAKDVANSTANLVKSIKVGEGINYHVMCLEFCRYIFENIFHIKWVNYHPSDSHFVSLQGHFMLTLVFLILIYKLIHHVILENLYMRSSFHDSSILK